MKTLVLMRHGKSSWEYDVSDRERPLKKRGINDATLVSGYFKSKNITLELVASSPANRAYSTCKIFCNILQIPLKSIKTVEGLYDFSGQNVIDFIKALDDSYKNVMIFGHNHAFTSISNIFGDVFIDNLPTSGLVAIDFDIKSWKTISSGKTRFTIFPRDFK